MHDAGGVAAVADSGRACAGYLLFEQVRWRSQVQLQGMQAIAFLLVASGNYLDTGSWPALVSQVLLQLPSIGACCQGSLAQACAIGRAGQQEGSSVLSCVLPARSCRPSSVAPCGAGAWCMRGMAC